ncbi:hypothetical protein D3C86_1094550 [compost metagenome]
MIKKILSLADLADHADYFSRKDLPNLLNLREKTKKIFAILCEKSPRISAKYKLQNPKLHHTSLHHFISTLNIIIQPNRKTNQTIRQSHFGLFL